MTADRRRFAIAALVMTAGTALAIALAIGWVLDPPWSFVSVPIGAALGWWSGRKVLARIILGDRRKADR